MDFQSLKQMTPRKAILFVLILCFAFAFGIIIFLSLFAQNSMGLSGATLGAPAMYTGAISADESGMNVQAKRMMNGVSAESYMPEPPSVTSAPLAQSMVIKSGELAMRVDDVDLSIKKIDAIRIEVGAQIGNSTVSDYQSMRQGNVTLWIPSVQFESVMERIKGVAFHVTNERVTATDVSAQFVDLEARLRNLRSTEAQYLEIMKRSGSISDVLQVTSALSQTRQSIEQLQGQQNHLSRQVALSSLHISLTQEISSAVISNEWRPLAVLKNSTRETLRSLTAFVDQVIVFLVYLPVLLLKLVFWGGLLYVVVRVAKKLYVHLKGSALP